MTDEQLVEEVVERGDEACRARLFCGGVFNPVKATPLSPPPRLMVVGVVKEVDEQQRSGALELGGEDRDDR